MGGVITPSASSAEPADDGHCREPGPAPPHQGIERENAALAVVVGIERKQHVFDRGLQRQGPDNAGNAAQHQLFVNPGPGTRPL